MNLRIYHWSVVPGTKWYAYDLSTTIIPISKITLSDHHSNISININATTLHCQASMIFRQHSPRSNFLSSPATPTTPSTNPLRAPLAPAHALATTVNVCTPSPSTTLCKCLCSPCTSLMYVRCCTLYRAMFNVRACRCPFMRVIVLIHVFICYS